MLSHELHTIRRTVKFSEFYFLTCPLVKTLR